MATREQPLTIGEAAEYLRLSTATTYKLASRGQLPGKKVGGQWRFSLEVLERYLDPGAGDVPREAETEL